MKKQNLDESLLPGSGRCRFKEGQFGRSPQSRCEPLGAPRSPSITPGVCWGLRLASVVPPLALEVAHLRKKLVMEWLQGTRSTDNWHNLEYYSE